MGNREGNVAKTGHVKWVDLPWVKPMAMDVLPLRGEASGVLHIITLVFIEVSRAGEP